MIPLAVATLLTLLPVTGVAAGVRREPEPVTRTVEGRRLSTSRAPGVIGRVVDDSTGEPVAGALVLADGEPGAHDVTDGSGSFQLDLTTAGRHPVSVVSSGRSAGVFHVDVPLVATSVRLLPVGPGSP